MFFKFVIAIVDIVRSFELKFRTRYKTSNAYLDGKISKKF